MVQLTGKTIIGSNKLKAIADSRMEDAKVLLSAGRYLAAIYLGGYSVECCLKAAICKTLDIEELPSVFAVHDLELLLLFSGLMNQMKADGKIHGAFTQLKEVWKESEKKHVRYEDPALYNEVDAKSFLNWVHEVVEWVKPKT